MNGGTITLLVGWIFIVILLIIEPWFTRRNVLFGVVFGNDDIWKDDGAKRIRMQYLSVMIAGTIIISLLFLAWSLFEKLDLTAIAVPYSVGIGALLVYGAVVFVVFHTKMVALKTAKGADASLVHGKVSVETSLPTARR